MTRFVVDCGVVLELAADAFELPPEHELLAPTLLRSQMLSALHEAVHRGELSEAVALQADAFVTSDPALARRVEGVVATATIDALRPA